MTAAHLSLAQIQHYAAQRRRALPRGSCRRVALFAHHRSQQGSAIEAWVARPAKACAEQLEVQHAH